MTRRFFFLVLTLLTLVGCGYDPRIDPPLFTYDNATLTRASAELHARDAGGYVTLPVLDTHSMEPLIYGGDLLVALSSIASPFDLKRLRGRVILYHPDWNPALLVCHRVVSGDDYGLQVEGDHVDGQHPEGGKWRVTEANYVGEVVAIYRTKPL